MDHNVFIAALTVWREARGEPLDGQHAVAHVIRNRANSLAMRQDLKNLPEAYFYIVCTTKWQFSSITATNDPQLGLYPKEDDFSFIGIVDYIQGIEQQPDPTNGATHYFNPSIVLPEWAKTMTQTAKIGNHVFYK